MSQTLKAIIVEDEAASRTTLNNYLKKYCPSVEVMEMCDSIKSGLTAIKNNQPDLVFLDIEMPYGNAFDLLESLDEIEFEIVFVTAYKDYAMKALNLSAAYYILKPIDIDELVYAVEKILKRKHQDDHILHSKILMENIKSNTIKNKKVVLPQMDGFEVINIGEIIRIEANDNYANVHLMNGEKHLVSKTLKYFDEMLCEYDFIRTHKSHLVNMQHITKYIKGKVGRIKMIDGSHVDVSATRKKELFNRLN